eukprot:8990121-Pyramimonas_sp.AAC.1
MPDVRTVNTFLRGCKMVGDVASAAAAFKSMRDRWRVSPDAPCHRLMARLLGQVRGMCGIFPPPSCGWFTHNPLDR